MDIILTGADNGMMEALIGKLRKEGHRIFVLSNERVKKVKYKRIFEQYDFTYDNENMSAIIESIAPDAIIFLGAFDGSFQWGLGQKEAVRFGEGLINIMEACSQLKKTPRFLYLSTSDVFTHSSRRNYREHDAFSPESVRAVAVRQGELICGNYYKSYLCDTVVARMDHIYGNPVMGSDLEEPMYHMLKAGIRQGVIPARKNQTMSMLHISDAVEFIYTLLITDELQHRVYNLCSERELTELDLAFFLKDGLGDSVEVELEDAEEHRVMMSRERFRDEFGGKVFKSYLDELPLVAKEVKEKHLEFFGPEEDKKKKNRSVLWKKLGSFLKAILPYLETIVLFIPAFMLNNRATGSDYFTNLDFYLLYVLFIAIIHGQQQSMIAGVLAVAGYFFRQQYDKSTFDVMLDYNTYIWITQLFIVGLVVGNLKDRLQVIRDEDSSEIHYLNSQVEDITEINTNNVLIKNSMEEQLINQHDSFGKVYEITSSLDQYAPEEVLFYAAEVLRELLHTDDVAIYSVANGDYARLFAATSKKARSLGNSLKYTDLTEMYAYINSDQVYINRSMKEGFPQMADALFSEGRMQLIIMTWGLPLERLNLSQSNLMRIAGFLIQNAVLRANRYMEALESSRYVENTQLLEETAFNSLLDAFLTARGRGLTECCVLRLPEIPKDQEPKAVEEVSKTLRNSDYLGKRKDGRLYILLSNTNTESADFVIKRLEGLGYPSAIWRNMN
ncbi:MAG: NAD-dependent epimerase/dehydratase family protein [Lachnospiraceae bacterium]|nr:NAD-dependent epimerase/dehydratase family protein [Lachnospiraceae bacterium]